MCTSLEESYKTIKDENEGLKDRIAELELELLHMKENNKECEIVDESDYCKDWMKSDESDNYRNWLNSDESDAYRMSFSEKYSEVV